MRQHHRAKGLILTKETWFPMKRYERDIERERETHTHTRIIIPLYELKMAHL